MTKRTFEIASNKAPFLLLILAFGLWLLHETSLNIFFGFQTLIFSLGLFFVGIPHGAVDYLLVSGNLNEKVQVQFVWRYLGAASFFFILWLIFPNVSMFFFLIYSALHFGQADMEEWKVNNRGTIKNFLWGCIVLGVVLFGHINETNKILDNMEVMRLPGNEQFGKQISILLVSVAFFWGFLEHRLAMILSAAMLALCLQLPLFTTFGLYFIGQHSLNGWSHLKQALKVDNWALIMRALPFTIGAFILYFTLNYCINAGYLEAFHKHSVTVFFVFVSCISFPHVIVMNDFYSKYFARPVSLGSSGTVKVK